MEYTNPSVLQDSDPTETREWMDALDGVIHNAGKERANYLMRQVAKHAVDSGVRLPSAITTPFHNTISPAEQATMPGDLFMERRIRSLIRWNAGHGHARQRQQRWGWVGIFPAFRPRPRSTMSASTHFFRGTDEGHPGDLSSTRATAPRASMRGPSSRAA
jgi:pyruvate dehydrogenase E1 component